jgi:hypothetical protein
VGVGQRVPRVVTASLAVRVSPIYQSEGRGRSGRGGTIRARECVIRNLTEGGSDVRVRYILRVIRARSTIRARPGRRMSMISLRSILPRGSRGHTRATLHRGLRSACADRRRRAMSFATAVESARTSCSQYLKTRQPAAFMATICAASLHTFAASFAAQKRALPRGRT